jgi:hypothetical protein
MPHTEQIAAHHRFDRQGLQFSHHHRPARQLRALLAVGDDIVHRQSGKMIGDYVPGLGEPEQ